MTREATLSHPEDGEHRISDALFVAGARLPLTIAKTALWGVAESMGDTETLFQERVGRNGEIFQLQKLRTEYADTKLPYNKLAKLFRKTGIDELSQFANIQAGDMSVFGWRPLTPEEYIMFLDGIEDPKTRDRWLKVVLPTRPGAVSSYGIGNHIKEVRGIDTMWGGKAELDIQDVIDDSFWYRVKILQQLFASLHPTDVKRQD